MGTKDGSPGAHRVASGAAPSMFSLPLSESSRRTRRAARGKDSLTGCAGITDVRHRVTLHRSCYRPRAAAPSRTEHGGAELRMTEQNLTERSMAVGLQGAQPIRLPALDRPPRPARPGPARCCTAPRKATVQHGHGAGRTFAAAQRLSDPPASHGGRRDLFDLTPDEEQQMLRDSVREFALARAAPRRRGRRRGLRQRRPSCSARPTSSGSRWSACPRSSGARSPERSAVTTVLDGRGAGAGRHGDRGRLPRASRASSTALRLWGDAEQQATYLPAFVGEDVPAAALALIEPRPLFDPFALQTRGPRAAAAGSCSSGVKSLVPARRRQRAVRRRRRARRAGPGAVHRRVGHAPASHRARARDGHARRRHRSSDPRGRQLPV